jgi:ribosomal protein L11 methyltransferase PrmA
VVDDVYTLDDYLWMLADEGRVTAYAEAIRRVVKPGDRVVEIGAGLGFFSVLAARAGAERVDAVDGNPIVHLGHRVAEANGVADRVHVHQLASEQFVPDRTADVIIADVRGPTPFAGRSLLTMIDARKRLLRPGGTTIARRDTLWCAPASTPGVFRREIVEPLERWDVCLDPVAQVAFDTPLRCPIGPAEVVAPAAKWAEIDYHAVDSTDAAGSASWTFERPVVVDGLAIWFDSDLAEGVRLSMAPDAGRHVYGHVFFPFRTAALVGRGETVRAAIATRLVRDEYVWQWKAWIAAGGGSERLVASQNSLAERVLDAAALANGRYNPTV